MSGHLASRAHAHRRGTRFAITTSLLYREHGTSKWQPGVTVNASHSGVLFRVRGAPPSPDRTLDFIVLLPLSGSSPATRVRCTGHVVRTEPSPFAGAGHVVAVAIDGYAIEGRGQA
jgi:hypothetical protein